MLTSSRPIHLVSDNVKTGYSINFPIEKTCNPTALCRKYCYARKGRLNMARSLTRQDAVYDILKSRDPAVVARTIADGCNRRHLPFLRWAGSGDMFPEAVEVLNRVAEQTPETRHWIATRKPEIVELIEPRPNIFIGFSLDSSTNKSHKQTVNELKHPRQYYSFVRQYPDEDTQGAAIIYNLHKNKKLLRDAKVEQGFICPVDGDRMEIRNACSKCRRCFNEKVLQP